MEQEIITIEASCKKFILDFIVPYDESYNLKKKKANFLRLMNLLKSILIIL